MIGWLVAWKCLVACLFFESSQQPTCPQVRQRRRCTHVSPVFKQSSHPLALGVTSRIWSRWLHCCAICFCSPSLMLLDALASFRKDHRNSCVRRGPSSHAPSPYGHGLVRNCLNKVVYI